MSTKLSLGHLSAGVKLLLASLVVGATLAAAPVQAQQKKISFLTWNIADQ